MIENSSNLSIKIDSINRFFKEFDFWLKSYLIEKISNEDKVGLTYHYTDAYGLKGIIESEKIFCTDYKFLNDPSEFNNDFIIKNVNKKYINDNFDREFSKYVNNLISIANSKTLGDFNKKIIEKLVQPFVFCCSNSSDYLDNWRHYGDNGRGFCIVFSRDFFNNLAVNQFEGNSLIFFTEMSYNKYNKIIDYDVIIGSFYNILKEFFIKNTQDFLNEFDKEQFFYGFLSRYVLLRAANAITTKHNSYKNENESRLVMVPFITGGKFQSEIRIRKGELVPYVAVPSEIRKPGMVTEIIVGPAAEPRSVDAVKSLLRSYQMDWIKVTKSQIPYRAL